MYDYSIRGPEYLNPPSLGWFQGLNFAQAKFLDLICGKLIFNRVWNLYPPQLHLATDPSPTFNQ